MASPKGGKTPFAIADHTVLPGKSLRLEIRIANLTSGTPISLPVVVHHGGKPGPAVWLSAAVHGDELCGVEIIRRVLSQVDARSLSGTLISVPIVNVHGFNTGDRYLPDRRDLNRSFPGSKRGSLASRVANLFMTEVVDRCTVGIDLHTGSDQRENLPQIRADLDDAPTLELAQAFGAPIAIHSRVRDGSLRQAATDSGATVLLYEAGEAGRFSENAIGTGVKGVLRVLHHLGVRDEPELDQPPVLISRTTLLILGDSLSAGYGLEPGQGWVSLLENEWLEQGSAFGDSPTRRRPRRPSREGGLACHDPRPLRQAARLSENEIGRSRHRGNPEPARQPWRRCRPRR